MGKTVKIGMVGVGDISGIYLQNITGCFKEIELVAVCDLCSGKSRGGRRKNIIFPSCMTPCMSCLQTRKLTLFLI